MTAGLRSAVADREIPENRRCQVPGDCPGYRPGESCCEADGFGTGWITGTQTEITFPDRIPQQGVQPVPAAFRRSGHA